MKLYILRHGQASPTGASDNSRVLTTKGETESLILANWIKRQSIQFDQIWSSPYVRAINTARIIRDDLNPVLAIEEKPNLIPSSHPLEVLDTLKEFNQSSLLIVSHMPLVGRLTHALMSGHEDEPMMFETCGLASLEVAEIRYQAAYLDWLVHPGILKC